MKVLKLGLVLTIMLLLSFAAFCKNPLDVIEMVKETKSWEQLFGMYEIISVVVVMIITQLGKYIPIMSKVKGKYRALVVTIIIVVIGAVKFGFSSVASPVIIWTIATLIYDKFFKKEKTLGKLDFKSQR